MIVFDVRFAKRIRIRSAAFASSSCIYISIRFSRTLPTLIPPKIAPALRHRHRHGIGEHLSTSYVLAFLRFESEGRVFPRLIPPAQISRSREYSRCSIFAAHQQRSAAFASSAPRQLADLPVCATRGALWAAGASLRILCRNTLQ